MKWLKRESCTGRWWWRSGSAPMTVDDMRSSIHASTIRDDITLAFHLNDLGGISKQLYT